MNSTNIEVKPPILSIQSLNFHLHQYVHPSPFFSRNTIIHEWNWGEGCQPCVWATALVVLDSNSTVTLKSLTAFSQIPLVYDSVSTKILAQFFGGWGGGQNATYPLSAPCLTNFHNIYFKNLQKKCPRKCWPQNFQGEGAKMPPLP